MSSTKKKKKKTNLHRDQEYIPLFETIHTFCMPRQLPKLSSTFLRKSKQTIQTKHQPILLGDMVPFFLFLKIIKISKLRKKKIKFKIRISEKITIITKKNMKK